MSLVLWVLNTQSRMFLPQRHNVQSELDKSECLLLNPSSSFLTCKVLCGLPLTPLDNEYEAANSLRRASFRP